MERYIWNSKTNRFDYTPRTKAKNGVTLYTREEVNSLYASCGEYQGVIDIDGVPTVAYIFTDKEIAIREKQKRIKALKKLLQKTDYQAIKFAEGIWTAEEYEELRAQRQMWRDEINACENYLATAKIHDELD